MAISYPDAIGEHVDTPERFATNGLQYTGYFEPAIIAPEQVSNLYLFVQNAVNTPLKVSIKINLPQSGGFLRSGKTLLAVETDEFDLEFTPGEAGLLTIPVTTTEHITEGKHNVTIEVKASSQKGSNRVRPVESISKLDNQLIDSPVGLNVVGSLGSTYTEKAVKKATFSVQVAGEPDPPERAPQTEHSYDPIWTEEEFKYFNQAVKELNLRQVKLKNELNPEKLYANLFGETTIRFADAGLPLRIGEAILMAKILTYSCQYFLGNPNRRNGLLVPIWEQALAQQVDTTDSLNVIRTIGYHHILRLSVAMGFGLIAQEIGKQLWPLEERQAVGNHIADSIEIGESLDSDFIYLPLLIGGIQIAKKLKLTGEDVNHTLALVQKAKNTRNNVFTDQDMAQAKKVYNHLLKKA